MSGYNKYLDPIIIKTAAAKVSPWVVALNVPASADDQGRARMFAASGTIIECEEAAGAGGRKYLSTVLTCASLFAHSSGVLLSDIKVNVLRSGGKLYKGEVLACDFHYNLAIVRIQSDSLLRTATLRNLDDILSIDANELLHLREKNRFQLHRCQLHPDAYKILPGTKIIAVGRNSRQPYDLDVTAGYICTKVPSSGTSCKELYRIEMINDQGNGGGPIINRCGEVIGIKCLNTTFLPTNIVSRWWKHFKSHREFCRPSLDLKVANLHDVRLHFAEKFVDKFSNISKGVVVTEVVKDSAAWYSGIRAEDVIVECDGKSIRSMLEFFEKIWDMAGKSVDVNILRASDGSQLKLSMTIEETAPDKFYRWKELSENTV